MFQSKRFQNGQSSDMISVPIHFFINGNNLLDFLFIGNVIGRTKS